MPRGDPRFLNVDLDLESGEPLGRLKTKRCFNIGFASGSNRAPPFALRPATIQAVASLGASIEVTLYPYDEPDRRVPGRRPSSG
jgi:hypothetical protein